VQKTGVFLGGSASQYLKKIAGNSVAMPR